MTDSSDTRMTLKRSVEDSSRAFVRAQRDFPVGRARDEAYAAQAQIFLDRCVALGVVGRDFVVVDDFVLLEGLPRQKIVDYVRRGRKNIAKIEKAGGYVPGRSKKGSHLPG